MRVTRFKLMRLPYRGGHEQHQIDILTSLLALIDNWERAERKKERNLGCGEAKAKRDKKNIQAS